MVQFRSSNEDGTVQNVAVDGGDEIEDAQENYEKEVWKEYCCSKATKRQRPKTRKSGDEKKT